MNLEAKLKDCKFNLDQINHFNPEPYYVRHFLKEYLKSVIETYEGIFEEANRDFGLFVHGKCTKEKFEDKANEKNDQFALKFISWFDSVYKNEHQTAYPKFIKNVISYFKENNSIPKITIKLLSEQRYEHDPVQEIKVELKGEKFRSKEQLQFQIKRQTPLFLELINKKRKDGNEPKIDESQVTVSAFLDLENYEDVEISYACEIYIPVLNRIIEESMLKVKQLIQGSD
jgi:hypothetical protein